MKGISGEQERVDTEEKEKSTTRKGEDNAKTTRLTSHSGGFKGVYVEPRV